MEKLWSPWRSQYIESFKDKKESSGCIFCAAPRNTKDPDSLVVATARCTFTVLNLYPYNNGHLMIVPYRHIQSLDDLTGEEHAEIFAQITLACKALKHCSNPAGFNIGANIGQVSGAGIADHIHFHVVPRWNGDTNFMPVLGEVKVLSQDLLQTKRDLQTAYRKLSLPSE